MAKHIGLVVFPDGDRRHFIYNAFNDKAWPELFDSRQAAEEAWTAYDAGLYDPFAIDYSASVDDEDVAVFTWDDHADAGKPPDFFTTASRLAQAITGPR